MTLGLALLVAYLAGSFPTAFLIGKARGVDPGREGSGNYGATNVFRTLGPGPALVALVVDVGKGYLPVALMPRWLEVPELTPVVYGLLLAAAAVVGHVFSVFLRLRGGKGVGTAFGAYLALAPWATLAAVLAWVAVVLATRIVSVASLSAALVLLVGAVVTDPADGGDVPLVATTCLLVVFVFWTHRSNIVRLARGEERPIGVARERRSG